MKQNTEKTMNTDQLVSILRSLKLTGMADALALQMQQPQYEELGFCERFSMLTDNELERRANNKIARNLHAAKFRYPMAAMEDIQYLPDRELNKNELERFAQTDWIDDNRNLVLMGAAGSGKTYVACAVGVALCRKGIPVRYVRTDDLLRELQDARLSGSYEKALQRYVKVPVLILDEFLLVRLSAAQTTDMLNLVERRYDTGSFIICTQYMIDGWYERLCSADDSHAICESIIDRIIHSTAVMTIGGDRSMRERCARQPDSTQPCS